MTKDFPNKSVKVVKLRLSSQLLIRFRIDKDAYASSFILNRKMKTCFYLYMTTTFAYEKIRDVRSSLEAGLSTLAPPDDVMPVLSVA